MRVAIDAAFRTAERHVHDGRLPRHQVRQRAGVILVHGRVIAQAALERAARICVLHAKAQVVEQLPVVGLGNDLDLHNALRRNQDFPDLVLQIQDIRTLGEKLFAGLEHRSALPLVSISLSAYRRFDGAAAPHRLRATASVFHETFRRAKIRIVPSMDMAAGKCFHSRSGAGGEPIIRALPNEDLQ